MSARHDFFSGMVEKRDDPRGHDAQTEPETGGNSACLAGNGAAALSANFPVRNGWLMVFGSAQAKPSNRFCSLQEIGRSRCRPARANRRLSHLLAWMLLTTIFSLFIGPASAEGDLPTFRSSDQPGLQISANQRTDGEGRISAHNVLKLYVSPTGVDLDNTTCHESRKCATLQRAYNVALSSYDLRLWDIIIYLDDGVYQGFVCHSAAVGANVSGVQIVGANGSRAAIIHDTSDRPAAIIAYQGCRLMLKGLTLLSERGSLVFPQDGAVVKVGQDIVAGPARLGKWHAETGGVIRFSHGFISVGDAPAELQPVLGGMIIFEERSQRVSLMNNPRYSIGFADVEQNGLLYSHSDLIRYSGAAGGAKFIASNGGRIETLGGSAGYFPGSEIGTMATGGSYSPSPTPTVTADNEIGHDRSVSAKISLGSSAQAGVIQLSVGSMGVQNSVDVRIELGVKLSTVGMSCSGALFPETSNRAREATAQVTSYTKSGYTLRVTNVSTLSNGATYLIRYQCIGF